MSALFCKLPQLPHADPDAAEELSAGFHQHLIPHSLWRSPYVFIFFQFPYEYILYVKHIPPRPPPLLSVSLALPLFPFAPTQFHDYVLCSR